MKLLSGRRATCVLQTLPNVFALQPKTDYQKLISHSVTELSQKIRAKTERQMCEAFDYAELRLKQKIDISRKEKTNNHADE